MLDHQTLEKLVSMRLSAMAQEYRRQLESTDRSALSFEERFAMFTDAEWTFRHNNRLKRLLSPYFTGRAQCIFKRLIPAEP